VATQYYDNEPSIVENYFRPSFKAAKKLFPYTREDFARRAVFLLCERIQDNDRKEAYEQKSFHELKSMVISTLGVFGDDRSGYHSFLTRYSKLGGFKSFHSGKSMRVSEKPKETSAYFEHWGLISHLCAKEQLERAAEAGEDLLSPDWEPVYEGPTEDEWT